MAVRICGNSGNFTDSIWLTGLSVGLQTSISYISTLGTSYAYSSTFAGDGSEVAGVAVYLMCYGTTASGYLYVVLRDSTNSQDVRTVTVDLSNFPSRFEGWTYFIFDSPATLTNGVNYSIGMRTSSTYQVYGARNSTSNNWARILVSTATSVSPVSGDSLNIVPHVSNTTPWTTFNVVMNNNSTDAFTGLYIYGCTLSYKTDANTCLRVDGTVYISTNGKLLIGSAGSPLPANYTAILEIVCTSNGQNGIRIFRGGELSAYGYQLYSYTYALLNANAAAGATTLTVDRETAWAEGDQVAIAGTGTSLGEVELRTLASNASGTSLTLSSGLTYSHLGSDGLQAEVVNLRRNVIIRSTSTYTTYIAVFGSYSEALNLSWVRLDYLGTTSSEKYGITLHNAAANAVVNISNCALVSWSGSVVYENSGVNFGGGITVENNVCYDDKVGHMVYLYGSTPSVLIQGNCFLMNSGCSYPAVNCNNASAIIKNNRVANSPYESFKWNPATPPSQFEGNVAHTCSRQGFLFSGNLTAGTVGSLTNRNYAWHCALSSSTAYAGMYILSATGTVFQGFDLCGNGVNSGSCNLDLGDSWDCTFLDCKLGGSSLISSKRGFLLSRAKTTWELKIIDCLIGHSTTPYTPHSVADIDWSGGSYGIIRGRNTVLGSTVKVYGVPGGGSRIYVDRLGQVSNGYGSWTAYGCTLLDQTYYITGPYSARLIPNSSSNKYEGYRKLVPVASGNSTTISVKVRKSSAAADGVNYNGNQPRLVLKANPLIGIDTDIVLATMTAEVGIWETLSGGTPTVNADAVLEVVVDCDGTAGFINVADMEAS